MRVKLNADVNGKAIWAEPLSVTARCFGISKCLNIHDWAYFTAVRFD